MTAMPWIRLDPITRKRLRRFRRIRRGYYSFLLLLAAIVLSLFSEYLANHRPIVLSYEGRLYFPTFRYYSMDRFGQEPIDDFELPDEEADYRRLQREFSALRQAYDHALASSGLSPAAILEASPHLARKDNRVWMPLIPYNPIENDFSYDSPPPNPPDSRHWLGTDTQGRDVLARLLYGFRIAIFFSLALVLVSQTIGAFLGSLQGYLSGWFDIGSQRCIEIWSTLPFLYIVIVLSLFFTPGFWLLLFIMALFQWMGITYYMRTEMYREKTREYCLAARALGASHLRVVFKHLLPNCLTPLVTLTPFAIVAGISALTSLDYLGYGLPAPTPSWGEMIDQALQSGNRGKLWLSLSPFAAISITLILVVLIGEAVREAFDPKPVAKYR